MSEQDSTGISRETAEVLIEEWRIAAEDERGDRKARVAYREAAAELEHNLEADDQLGDEADATR